MERLVSALRNSLRAFRLLVAKERAFQQEFAVFLLAIPVGFFLAKTWRGYALLLGVLLMLMIVEVLNTAVEAACDAVSRDYNVDIQFAKDCGSLAVLMAMLLAGVVWGFELVLRIVEWAGWAS